MAHYDPERLERSTRDVVARSSYLEIMAGRGTPAGGVLLDISHLGADGGRAALRRDGRADAADRPRPGARAGRGLADRALPHGRRRDRPRLPHVVDGLLVAGEDAGGAHGANRLGGNGVAESTVFGARAGDTAPSSSATGPLYQPEQELVDASIARAYEPLAPERGRAAVRRSPTALKETMWAHCGLVRTRRGPAARRATGSRSCSSRRRGSPSPAAAESNPGLAASARPREPADGRADDRRRRRSRARSRAAPTSAPTSRRGTTNAGSARSSMQPRRRRRAGALDADPVAFTRLAPGGRRWRREPHEPAAGRVRGRATALLAARRRVRRVDGARRARGGRRRRGRLDRAARHARGGTTRSAGPSSRTASPASPSSPSSRCTSSTSRSTVSRPLVRRRAPPLRHRADARVRVAAALRDPLPHLQRPAARAARRRPSSRRGDGAAAAAASRRRRTVVLGTPAAALILRPALVVSGRLATVRRDARDGAAARGARPRALRAHAPRHRRGGDGLELRACSGGRRRSGSPGTRRCSRRR